MSTVRLPASGTICTRAQFLQIPESKPQASRIHTLDAMETSYPSPPPLPIGAPALTNVRTWNALCHASALLGVFVHFPNQDQDEIKRGADFVAPQYIEVPNHYPSNLPHYPSKATHDEVAGVVKLRHTVDATGKTMSVQMISEPPGYQLGDYLKKVVPLLDFSPGYRNEKPTITTYTLTWWFGRPVGR
jgi:hypothetical protein